jgi:hypothetical protein
MTGQLRDRPDEGDEPPHALRDVRCFALVVAAVAVGVLLYVKPAAGLAVLGAVTVLAALARLVRR